MPEPNRAALERAYEELQRRRARKLSRAVAGALRRLEEGPHGDQIRERRRCRQERKRARRNTTKRGKSS
jgi:hypothetical protein